jgi:hypothetical protein
MSLAIRKEGEEERIVDPEKNIRRSGRGMRQRRAPPMRGKRGHNVSLGEACVSETKGVLRPQDPFRRSPTRAREHNAEPHDRDLAGGMRACMATSRAVQ